MAVVRSNSANAVSFSDIALIAAVATLEGVVSERARVPWEDSNSAAPDGAGHVLSHGAGMDARYVFLYLTAMREEAMTATFAFSRIEIAVHALRKLNQATVDVFTENGDEERERTSALNNKEFLEIMDVEENLASAIEAFLSAQTRLSLFVSPSPNAKGGARTTTRAAILRERLAMEDGDNRGDRGLRNAWMHIDESIDTFVFERAAEADLIIRHVGTVAKDRKRFLKLIDPSTLTVWLLGEEHSLPAINDWVSAMDRRLAVALQQVEAELDK